MSKRKRDILALEQRVKDIYWEDKTNPELYTAIKDLAEAVLVVKRMVPYADQVDNISHSLACDLYMSISRGELEVGAWTKYVMLRLRTYRGRYYDETKKSEVLANDIIDTETLINRLYGSSKFHFSNASTLELEDLIEYYPQFLLKQYDKCVRYVKGSVEYNNTCISIMRNILDRRSNPEHKVSFRSDDSLEYLEVLEEIIMKKLESYSNILCEGDKTYADATSQDLIHSYKSFVDE